MPVLHRRALRNAEDALRRQRLASRRQQEALRIQEQGLGTGSWSTLRPFVAAHGVHFAQDADLLARLSAYVAEGLLAGQTCVVAATAAHATGLRRRLELAGLDPTGVLVLDAADLLERLLVDGQPDGAAFETEVATVVRSSAPRVRVFGELVGLLHDRGHTAGVLALERLWAGLQRELGFPLLCGYPASADSGPLRAAHTHLVS